LITGDFCWDDIGDWAAMQRVIEVDDGENAVDADVEGDNEDCIVFGDDKIIEMGGFKGLIVVDTKDALLICRKERAQDVKKVVEILEKSDKLKKYAEDFVENPEKHYVPIDCENVHAKNINKVLATIGLKDMNIEETEEKIIIKNR